LSVIIPVPIYFLCRITAEGMSLVRNLITVSCRLPTQYKFEAKIGHEDFEWN